MGRIKADLTHPDRALPGWSVTDRALIDPRVTMDFDEKHPAPAAADRRLIALIVFALAVAVALSAPGLFGLGQQGRASAEPLPLPPPVGSCVVVTGAGYNAGVTMVSCQEPHSGEITKTWTAGEDPTASGAAEANEYSYRSGGGVSRFVYFQCYGWNTEYVGSERGSIGGLWASAPPSYSGEMIYAPPGQRAGKLFWSACLVRPLSSSSHPTYVGTIRGAGQDSSKPRPGEFGSCLTRSAFGATEFIYGSCADPHLIEPMAVDAGARLNVADPVQQADALAQCSALVAKRTGSVDPTYGGQLRIAVDALRLRTLTMAETAQVTPDDPADPAECLVQLTGAGTLVGSIVGLGNNPLPIS